MSAHQQPPRRCRPASPTVGSVRDRVKTGISRSTAALILAATLMASSELPPSAKKSSSRPTRPRPSTSAQTAATVPPPRCAAPSRGGDASARGAGRARRSTLPLGSRGSRSRATKAEGHHVGGEASADRRIARRVRRRRLDGRLRHDVGDQAVVLRGGPRGRGRRAGHARWRARVASISPSSMRKPRILTWPSARPRYSIVPVGAPADQVAGAVHACRRARRRGRRRSARRSGRAVEVAAGRAGPAR